MTAVAFMANGQSGETLVFLKKANGGNEINQAADYSENGIVTIEVVDHDQQYKYASWNVFFKAPSYFGFPLQWSKWWQFSEKVWNYSLEKCILSLILILKYST